MFTTHADLNNHLIESQTWSALYAALHASTELIVRTLPATEGTGLRFSAGDRTQHITGEVTIDPTTGAMTVHADGLPGTTWHTALLRLATITANTDAMPAWSWRPSNPERPGTFTGTVPLRPGVTAQVLMARHGSSHSTASAALALTPATRDTCHLAWSHAITALGTLATADPAYRPTILPTAITPTQATATVTNTDYPAAARTVDRVLELLDENEDFGHARDEDPLWPTDDEGDAIRALRHLRDVLDATPANT